jgi:quercetin dioxygenase-like cupin family protein
MSQRPRSPSTTGGSDEREARPLTEPLMRFDLAGEAARLRAESAYVEGDRNARTLAKAGYFRMVLVAFRAGATFDENDQRGTVALQLLEGRLTVCVGQERIELAAGEVAVVTAEHPWIAVAAVDGLLLIGLSWPPEAGSRET